MSGLNGVAFDDILLLAEVIAESSQVSGEMLAACKEYEAYVGIRTASAK
jgi:hypothetical protein